MRSIKKKLCALGLIILCACLLVIGCENQGQIIESEIPEGEELEIHYIDVGQADATLVKCGGEAMLIDGGNVEDSSLMYTYLKNEGVDELKYMIATHAHEDHIGGLAGALNYAKAQTVYCPVTYFDTEAFGNFKKYVQAQGNKIIVPDAGAEFRIGHATCKILALNMLDDDPNNTSIVMKMVYGDTSFLFCGDAEKPVEDLILASGQNVKCTVLKVPHHGSSSSLSNEWLLATRPEYGVISVGENNDHDHPHDSTLRKLKLANVEVYRTDMQGHIVCVSDGKEVRFETGENIETVTRGEVPESGYVLNIRSMKFHYPNCASVEKISEKNRLDTELPREEIIEKGYEPCGNCRP